MDNTTTEINSERIATPNTNGNNKTAVSSWSWGGAMFPELFLIGMKEWNMLIMLIVGMCIPIVNIIVIFGRFFYFGQNMHTIIANSKIFCNESEREGVKKVMNYAGYISFFITIVIFVIWFISLLGILGFAYSMRGAIQPSNFQ